MLGLTQLHLYSETRDARGNWVADKASTFKVEHLVLGDGQLHTMEQAPCPQDLPLFGLLSEGAWESLPWSCWERGMPEDASPEVQIIGQEWAAEAYGHNYLTLQELIEKYTQVTSDPRRQARLIEHSLAEMLYALTLNTPSSASPEDRRVVFWFH